jgi:DNA-binding NarL/FixJ family response regulator
MVVSTADPVRPVLVVDDDEGVRSLLHEAFVQAGHEVVEARDGREALELTTAFRPALVVLDVFLPRVGGYETCRQLRERFGDDLPIIFVSGERTEASDRTAGLLLGADDYLAKPFDPDELLARGRRLLRRVAPVRTLEGQDVDAFAELTPRELEVLRLLARGLRQPEIARNLVISPKTAATHIQHILGKLGVHSRAEAVAYAHGQQLSV